MSLLILGAGPTGLGAAWRLKELGHTDWTLLESNPYAGGLSHSFVDPKGFTWDIGGHVQFSHYEYFDRVMDDLLGADGWLHHERAAWVWMRDRFIPYPLQYNVHRLPPSDLWKCLQGFLALHGRPAGAPPADFREWILKTFGPGMAEVFLFPYNFKVWATPAEQMNAVWVGERVAIPDFEKVLYNVVHQQDATGWGPNNLFHFPKKGGTGAIWDACANRLPADKIQYGDPVTSIDLAGKTVTTGSGKRHAYTRLLSTIPLTSLIRLSGRTELEAPARKGLVHSSSNIIGVGLRGQAPDHLRKKSWIYFPENDAPFYRVTVFSNYSPNNVPDPEKYWSIMTETSESSHKPVQGDLLEATIQGLLNTKLISSRDEIVSTWSCRMEHGYPVPGLHRDEALAAILPVFEKEDVFPRGRFGGWKYEVSNQDHSFMQGVEWASRMIKGTPEMTYPDPALANSKKHPASP